MSDLINRQAAIDAIVDLWADKPFGNPALTEIKERIEKLPSAEPERKRGEWMPENRRPKSWSFYCSVCHRTAYDPQNHHSKEPKRCRYAFCPNCGARMVSEDDS